MLLSYHKKLVECFAKHTFPFPTWLEPISGKKLPGPEKSLATIAQTFNCTLNDQPSNQIIESTTPLTQKQITDEAGFIKTQSSHLVKDSSPYPLLNDPNLRQKQQKLASCLQERNIVLYGITKENSGKKAQLEATKNQLEELGAAAAQIKVVDCSAEQADCQGILVYPTWVLENKNELAGVYELTNLAQILNCPLD